ncbi:hypothetical protein [Agrobacterium cavarae]|uniref:hypothetical protein n=1 Tax=Agrobacterium cavarae TaxID=2528239 RepID=UPI0028B1CAF3|nr:hypothetical protein [Agrobacterium cavarae]
MDDNEDELNLYSNLLSHGELEFKHLIRPEDLGATKRRVLNARPAILALDYRLDELSIGKGENDYKAGALAQALREEAVDELTSDFPIVLISTEEKIHKFFSPDKTAHDLFDYKLLKSEVVTEAGSAKAAEKMLALAEGYKRIIDNIGTETLVPLLAISEEDWDAAKPSGVEYQFQDFNDVPHVIARYWIRNFIERCGLLLAEKDIVARLGISSSTPFDSVRKLLVDSGLQYEGIFGSGFERFWRFRFDEWAAEQFGKPLTSLSGDERAEKASSVFGVTLEPAVSRWNGSTSELFAFACSACDHPTELRNSLAVHDPSRPAFCERRRVCFDCISMDEPLNKRGIRVDEIDEPIAKEIRDGVMRRK